MGWLVLILVLLAAAFGVLGVVLKLTAVIVFTVLLTMLVLGTILWYSIKAQLRRWERDGTGGTQVRTWTWGGGSERSRNLPSHDDRY